LILIKKLYWRSMRRFTLLTIALIAGGAGCTTYTNEDHNPPYSQLLGHQCVVVKSASFPESRWIWLPTFTPPGNTWHFDLVPLESGTVIGVDHLESWYDPFGSSGVWALGDVQTSKHAEKRITIGIFRWNGAHPYILCVCPPLGLSVEAGRSLRPRYKQDRGVFHAGEWSTRAGGEYNDFDLSWSTPSIQNETLPSPIR
jgi:hypothetical protein